MLSLLMYMTDLNFIYLINVQNEPKLSTSSTVICLLYHVVRRRRQQMKWDTHTRASFQSSSCQQFPSLNPMHVSLHSGSLKQSLNFFEYSNQASTIHFSSNAYHISICKVQLLFGLLSFAIQVMQKIKKLLFN